MSGPMPWISFLIFQVLVSTTITPLAAGEGCRIEAAVGGEADLVAGREDFIEGNFPMVVVDLLDGILVRRVLVELKEGHGLEVLLGIEDELAAAQSHDGGRPAAARV